MCVSVCVCQLYRFGETVSLVFWTDTWRPESFYDRICKNREAGQHTLCLLGETHTHTDDTLLMLEDTTRCCFWLKALLLLTDIKVKEQSEENMMRLEPLSSFSCS